MINKFANIQCACNFPGKELCHALTGGNTTFHLFGVVKISIFNRLLKDPEKYW